ncbi:MAG TPA: hypothetical protein VI488_16825 [Candidatus Angelobacter sp.]
MELIDRYLQAIRFWLPRNQKRDIIQELSEDLHSQIEEREATAGRQLTEDEIAIILKQRGNPIRVASAYLPQQQLIGPVLFPIYSFALKMVALFYLVPWILVWIGFVIFDPAYRAHHLGVGLLDDWVAFWRGAFFVLAAITFVFAAMERAQAKSKFLDNWDPRRLPRVVKHRKPSFRTQNFFDLFFNANFVVAWVALGHYLPRISSFPSELFRLGRGLEAYYWVILCLALVNLAQQITNVARPQWTWLRPATLLLTNSGSLVITCLVMRMEPLLVLKDADTHVARDVHAVATVNTIIHWSLVGLAVSVLVACCVYGYQIVQFLRRRQGPPGMPAPVQNL